MGHKRDGQDSSIAMPDKLIARHLNAYFFTTQALKNVDLGFAENHITAIIGPSGCGKSTLVRCLNRMHEVVPGARAEGQVLLDLKTDYTIVLVTHNMQQAARTADFTAFMYTGDLIEFGETKQIFTNPARRETEDYITGRFG